MYLAEDRAGTQQLVWLDRSGKQLSTVGEPADIGNMQFSPDRKRVAAWLSGPDDIWIFDVDRGLRTRFTFGPAKDDSPVWSPDGGSIVFRSSRKGSGDLYRRASDLSGTDELLYADGFNKVPTSWSPDGKFLLYYAGSPNTKEDMWVLPLTGERKPHLFLQTPFREGYGVFSPDGRWIAYEYNESNRFEVYVAPFPGPGGKHQISTAGGQTVRWSRDGKEIFYLTPANQLMAAQVNASGASFEAGAVKPLFTALVGAAFRYSYDVSADGQRFLFCYPLTRGGDQSLTLVQNWTAGLKK